MVSGTAAIRETVTNANSWAPTPTTMEILEVGTSNLCFNKPSGDLGTKI